MLVQTMLLLHYAINPLSCVSQEQAKREFEEEKKALSEEFAEEKKALSEEHSKQLEESEAGLSAVLAKLSERDSELQMLKEKHVSCMCN